MTGTLDVSSAFPLNRSAAQGFFVLSQVAKLLTEGHLAGHEVTYRITEDEVHIAVKRRAAKENAAEVMD